MYKQDTRNNRPMKLSAVSALVIITLVMAPATTLASDENELAGQLQQSLQSRGWQTRTEADGSTILLPPATAAEPVQVAADNADAVDTGTATPTAGADQAAEAVQNTADTKATATATRVETRITADAPPNPASTAEAQRAPTYGPTYRGYRQPPRAPLWYRPRAHPYQPGFAIPRWQFPQYPPATGWAYPYPGARW